MIGSQQQGPRFASAETFNTRAYASRRSRNARRRACGIAYQGKLPAYRRYYRRLPMPLTSTKYFLGMTAAYEEPLTIRSTRIYEFHSCCHLSSSHSLYHSIKVLVPSDDVTSFPRLNSVWLDECERPLDRIDQSTPREMTPDPARHQLPSRNR